MDFIKSLDEGRDFMNNESFSKFIPGVHTFKLDYGFLFSRGMKKPLLEGWRFNWK